MDAGAVTSLISGVGFPIAMCLMLLYVYLKSNEEHKEEIGKLSAVIQENTAVISDVKTMLSTVLEYTIKEKGE